MTRKEAINTLANFKVYISGGGVTDKKANEALDLAIATLVHLPSAETKTKCIAQIKVDIEELVRRIKEEYDITDGWVSCSERLPDEEEKIYWVCTDSGYQCQCRWTDINHFWTDLTTDWHWHIMDVPQYSKVVAWRELPLPYSEETNDEMVCDEVRREDLATKNDKRFFNALKPNKEIDRSWGIGMKVPVCPNCEAIISPMCFWKNCGDKVGWCEYCGQKIDWSGWEEE